MEAALFTPIKDRGLAPSNGLTLQHDFC